MNKKHYVFWEDEQESVTRIYNTWDKVLHISRTGCKGFKAEHLAIEFAAKKRKEYNATLTCSTPTHDDGGYMDSLLKDK